MEIGYVGGKLPGQVEANHRLPLQALKNHPWSCSSSRTQFGICSTCWLGSHVTTDDLGWEKWLCYEARSFFFFFSGNYGRLLLGLSFIVWGPWCHGCSWEHKLLVARHQESSSFSSCSPHMELDGCRFLSDVYKILRESEVDLKALDDPFNRSRAFENWNNYNNEAMGLGLSWGRESTFCVNEDESLRNFHK